MWAKRTAGLCGQPFYSSTVSAGHRGSLRSSESMLWSCSLSVIWLSKAIPHHAHVAMHISRFSCTCKLLSHANGIGRGFYLRLSPRCRPLVLRMSSIDYL